MLDNRKAQKLIPEIRPEYVRLLLLGLLGVVLLVAGSMFSKSSKMSDAQQTGFDVTQYERNLAKEVERVISAIKGAGKVVASVRVQGGPVSEYATNVTRTRNSQTETNPSGDTREVYSEQETVQAVSGRLSGESILPVRVNQPQVSGCLVIAEGAGDPVVKEAIYRAVQVLLDIPIYKIQVLPMGRGR